MDTSIDSDAEVDDTGGRLVTLGSAVLPPSVREGIVLKKDLRQLAMGALHSTLRKPSNGGFTVKASVLYRIASVLLVLFAVAHTAGFRQADPAWGAEAVIGAMQSVHFDVQGFSRSYWDFFVGAGLSVGVFFLFAGVLAWQLGGLPPTALASMRGVAWALALCFAAITAVSWRYLFILPVVFAGVITLCLAAAAWRSAKPDLAG